MIDSFHSLIRTGHHSTRIIAASHTYIWDLYHSVVAILSRFLCGAGQQSLLLCAPKGGGIIMIDYNDPNDPNYDPFWRDKETGHNGPIDRHDLSGFELEELEETYIQEMREEGLLRP